MGERRVGNYYFLVTKPVGLFECFTLCACITKIKIKMFKKVRKSASFPSLPRLIYLFILLSLSFPNYKTEVLPLTLQGYCKITDNKYKMHNKLPGPEKGPINENYFYEHLY